MLFSSCNFFSRFNEHLLPQVTTTIDKISAVYATLLLAPQEEGSGGGNKHIRVIEKMYVVLHSILQKHVDLLVLKLKPVCNRSVQIPSESSSTVRTTLPDNNAQLSFILNKFSTVRYGYTFLQQSLTQRTVRTVIGRVITR